MHKLAFDRERRTIAEADMERDVKRRTFLQSLAAAVSLPTAGLSVAPALAARTAGESASAAEAGDDALRWMQSFIARNDERIPEMLARQTTDEGSAFVGGFPDRHQIHYVGSAAWQICHLVVGLVSQESRFFQSAQVEDRLNLAMQFVRRMQHEDGTIDLISTNFHSPPDTAFVVEPISLALNCVRRHQPARLTRFQDSAGKFLRSAGDALARGGVHTPNHRWVVCMALSRIHQIFPDPRLVQRVDQWLAEGIDIDADGQYSERSTSVYSPLVDRCLITVARTLERPELYEPVRKNLRLTRYLIRPNGELVTAISRRQDQFRQSLAAPYYYPYRWMACHDREGSFAAMARVIEESVGRENLSEPCLYHLEDPAVLAPLPPASPLTDQFERMFATSKIVRIRRGAVDATIVGENTTFFSLHKGAAVLQAVRVATAFFGKGQFAATTLEGRDGTYHLTQQLEGPYVQPLTPELLNTASNWEELPHAQRAKSDVQHLNYQITIRETHGQFHLHFQIHGTERIPWAVELGFRPGGKLTGATPVEGIPGASLAGTGETTYRVGNDVLKIGPGPVEHRWTRLRGALPKLDAESVYFTGFTPLDFELTIG
jgi:hypothetical protein